MFEITKMSDLPEKCMFFGYGSLMFAHGINGRGLAHIYTNADLFPVRIKGLRRSMSADWKSYISSTRYYSVAEHKKSKVFGVLFDIHSRRDLLSLLISENAFPAVLKNRSLYKLYDISDKFSTLYTGNLPKLTLMCKELKDNPKLYAPGYIDYVYSHIPEKYKEKFLATGGLKR